jgi:superfamily I DNA/RNA helicase
VNRQVLLAGGYYGSGVKTFLSWLAARVEENDAQPDPRVVDEEAVTVTTWHSAKGLEWPVVAVCGMHLQIKPHLPDVSVTYDDFDDLANILRKAGSRSSPALGGGDDHGLPGTSPTRAG